FGSDVSMDASQAAARSRFVHAEDRSRLAQTKVVKIIELYQQSIFILQFLQSAPERAFYIVSCQIVRQCILRAYSSLNRPQGVGAFTVIASQTVYLGILFRLHQPRLFTMLINGQLPNYGAQPSA